MLRAGLIGESDAGTYGSTEGNDAGIQDTGERDVIYRVPAMA